MACVWAGGVNLKKLRNLRVRLVEQRIKEAPCILALKIGSVTLKGRERTMANEQRHGRAGI